MNDKIYCTSFCNFGHRMKDGKPINHECYVIPSSLLKKEIENSPDCNEAWHKWSMSGRKLHKGIKLK